jgi:hypothetical protein
MEVVWKVLFWVVVIWLFFLYRFFIDPTVKASRKKRKQEKLAMDFHTDLERKAGRDKPEAQT